MTIKLRNDIKRCPFCGSLPELSSYPIRGYEPANGYSLECPKCGCHPRYPVNDNVYEKEETVINKMIDLWNTRTEV